MKVVSIFSPGRFNIIGEHTDHQGGLVLPACIQQGITIHASLRLDNKVMVYAESYNEKDVFDSSGFDLDDGWKKYIRAVIDVFQREEKINVGVNLWITSNMPISGGLSSSAALEVGILNALYEVTEREFSDNKIIRLAHKAENELVGVKCGIMDQTIVQLGMKNKGILLDCSDHHYEYMYIPKNIAFLLIDTGIQRNLSDSQYNMRVETLQQALLKIRENEKYKHIEFLSQLSLADLNDVESMLSQIEFKRLRHVINENARVKKFYHYLEIGKEKEAGSLLYLSHESLKNDFEASWDRADLFVDLIKQNSPSFVYGARMVGAGWGGSILVMLEQAMVQQFKSFFAEKIRQYIAWEISYIEITVGQGAHITERTLLDQILSFLAST
ncbi:MAG: galactokinase [Candidatus Heimdallarchaeota archaeon]|nr:galactokinase [Candidatus Heimdallarchaeota archaeon]